MDEPLLGTIRRSVPPRRKRPLGLLMHFFYNNNRVGRSPNGIIGVLNLIKFSNLVVRTRESVNPYGGFN